MHEIIIAPSDAAKTDVSLSQMHLRYSGQKMMDSYCSFEFVI